MSLNNLKTRINFSGGHRQQDRMNLDKLRSLKKALIYSYQSATAILPDGREFRCLINPNKISMDLDNKILSIPFKDICLNSSIQEGEVDTNIKEGDVIEWKENNSHWIVFLQRLEETAYFRADLRRCRHQIALENGQKYWVYIRGPVEQSLVWMQGNGNYINQLNGTLQIYITQNEETLKFFHRFAKIKLNGNSWEVQAIDAISTPGIIEVALKEVSNNTPKDDLNKAVEQSINVLEIDEKQEEYIFGPTEIYPYETHTYELKNSHLKEGIWSVSELSKKDIVKIVSTDGNKVTLSVLTGKRASFKLNFLGDNHTVSLLIDIKSL